MEDQEQLSPPRFSPPIPVEAITPDFTTQQEQPDHHHKKQWQLSYEEKEKQQQQQNEEQQQQQQQNNGVEGEIYEEQQQQQNEEQQQQQQNNGVEGEIYEGQQLQQQQWNYDDEGYFSNDLEEGEIREEPQEKGRRSPIIGRRNEGRRSPTKRNKGIRRKINRRRHPYRRFNDDQWLNKAVRACGQYNNRDTYMIACYRREKIPLLVGTRHRTQNGIEKDYGVKLHIPDTERNKPFWPVIIVSRDNNCPQNNVHEALREIYQMML